jgi:diacylglycerol kinase family enzyme
VTDGTVAANNHGSMLALIPTTIIVNPRAGGARPSESHEVDLVSLFRAGGRDAQVVAMNEDDDPADAARRASVHEPVVVACGGDGTVSSVAAALCDTSTALGILPAGTLNHFAKDLKIPLDLREAVAVVTAGHVRRIDVGDVNGRTFVNNSSIGVYPSIVDQREALQRQGHRKWTAMLLAIARVLRRHRGITVTVDVDGVRRRWRSPFVFIGNNRYSTDGRALGTRMRLDEGWLFVYLTPRLRTRDLPRLLMKAIVGRAAARDFEIVPAKEVWIDTRDARPTRVAVDGEVVTMEMPLHYRARPAALTVLAPEPAT